MTDAPKRRSLLADLDRPTPRIAEADIAATAGRHGFVEPAADPAGPPGVSEAAGRPSAARRQRQPTGRVHQLNVRLRAQTIESIYTLANGRDIPVAQVIEEAMAALESQAVSGGKGRG